MVRAFCFGWKKWVPNDGHLILYVDGENLDVDLYCKVHDFMLSQGEWDVGKLTACLLENVCRKILAIHVPKSIDFLDIIVWIPSNDGSFSLKSSYMFITNKNSDAPNLLLKTIC